MIGDRKISCISEIGESQTDINMDAKSNDTIIDNRQQEDDQTSQKPTSSTANNHQTTSNSDKKDEKKLKRKSKSNKKGGKSVESKKRPHRIKNENSAKKESNSANVKSDSEGSGIESDNHSNDDSIGKSKSDLSEFNEPSQEAENKPDVEDSNEGNDEISSNSTSGSDAGLITKAKRQLNKSIKDGKRIGRMYKSIQRTYRRISHLFVSAKKSVNEKKSSKKRSSIEDSDQPGPSNINKKKGSKKLKDSKQLTSSATRYLKHGKMPDIPEEAEKIKVEIHDETGDKTSQVVMRSDEFVKELKKTIVERQSKHEPIKVKIDVEVLKTDEFNNEATNDDLKSDEHKNESKSAHADQAKKIYEGELNDEKQLVQEPIHETKEVQKTPEMEFKFLSEAQNDVPSISKSH